MSIIGKIVCALRNHAYERTEAGGLYLNRERAFIGGVFRTAYCPAGGEFESWQVDPNRLVNEGLNYVLNAAFAGASQTSAFFLAPFSGNVTPAANWTGANFAAQSNEFTAYTNGTRLPWTVAPSTALSVGNTAAIAAATLTFDTGGPYSLFGVGLLEASAKSSVTGRLIAATRFATPRTNLSGGDKLALEYVISAKDEADV